MTRKFCVSSVALAKDNGMVSKSQKISAIPELQRETCGLDLKLDVSICVTMSTNVLANMFQIYSKKRFPRLKQTCFNFLNQRCKTQKNPTKNQPNIHPLRPRLHKARPFELNDLDEIQTSSIKKTPHKLAPPKTNWLGFTPPKWEVSFSGIIFFQVDSSGSFFFGSFWSLSTGKGLGIF